MFLKHAFKEFNWKFPKHLCLEANSVAVLPLPNGSDGAEWLGGCDNSPGQMCLATQGNQEMNTEGNFFDIWNFFQILVNLKIKFNFFLRNFQKFFENFFQCFFNPRSPPKNDVAAHFANPPIPCRSFRVHPGPLVTAASFPLSPSSHVCTKNLTSIWEQFAILLFPHLFVRSIAGGKWKCGDVYHEGGQDREKSGGE